MMRLHDSLAFLFSTLLCTSCTLALTLPESTDTTLATVNILNSEFFCAKGTRSSWVSRKFPRFRDCGGAIRQLNDNGRPGIFHSKGIHNEWQLPVVRSHHTCAVVVSMREGIKEVEGTWLSISLAATQLNIVCVGTSRFPTYQGGTTHAGLYDGVKVKLMYIEPGKSSLGVNGTISLNGTGNGATDVS